MKKLLNWFKSSKSDFALFLILIVLVNLAGYSLFVRADLTGPKSYSLSKASKTLVKNVQEPLSVRVFFDENLPSPYNSIAQYVKDMLVEYKGAANKHFSVSYMDMSKPENVELARDCGLNQIQIQEVKNNEVGFKQGYMGLVITYGDAMEVIDPITSSDGFEYKFTSKVSKMINTADTLAGLGKDETIKLKLYYSSALKGMRINGYDETEKLVKAALKEINKQNMDRIELEEIDAPTSQAEDLINNYGLQGISYKTPDGHKETAIIGLILQYGENFRVLPVRISQSFFGYTMAGLDGIQESIAEGLQSLLSKITKIGYITGHNELDIKDETYSANFDKLVSAMYEFVELDLTSEDIPAGMSSIVINGPQYDYTEEELYKIDQFLMRGGNIMFFIDSMNQDGTANYYGNQTYVPNESNLDRLLTKYGIKRDFNMVMDKNSYTTTNQQYGKINLYWAPVLQKGQLAKKHPITNNLGYVIMLQNGSIDVSAALDNSNVKTTVLAKSSDDSWTMDKDIYLNPIMCAPPSDKSAFHASNLAVLLEGKFESAFDQAPVIEQTDEEGNVIELPVGDLETSNHLTTSILPGKIFIIGSSSVTTRQVIDENGSNPIAMLLLNTVDYMNGNAELCTMRTKGLSVNTLTIKSKKAANFWKYFNEYGLVVILAAVGFIVWRVRSSRRKEINKRYNPDDTRTVEKKSNK